AESEKEFADREPLICGHASERNWRAIARADWTEWYAALRLWFRVWAASINSCKGSNSKSEIQSRVALVELPDWTSELRNWSGTSKSGTGGEVTMAQPDKIERKQIDI
ncbi:MAG TPA: hypothetical protein DCS60_07455, partial [Opitutae bacterium]|nr:hypothetical protein [Opitutae bacterium]